jgi:hypothetical protein
MSRDFADAQRRAAMARKLAGKAHGLGEYNVALLHYAAEAEAGRPPGRDWQLAHLGHLVGKIRQR